VGDRDGVTAATTYILSIGDTMLGVEILRKGTIPGISLHTLAITVSISVSTSMYGV
jgi:hypothetical protein